MRLKSCAAMESLTEKLPLSKKAIKTLLRQVKRRRAWKSLKHYTQRVKPPVTIPFKELGK